MADTIRNNMLIGIELKLMAHVIDAVPKLIEYLRQDMMRNYYMDIVLKDIEEENQLTSISADAVTMDDLQMALYGSDIYFDRIYVKPHYGALFDLESDSVIICKGSEYDRILEFLEKYKEEHELEEDGDEKDAPPEEGEEEEEEEPVDDTEEAGEEDEDPEEGEDEDDLEDPGEKKHKKRSDKAKRHREKPEPLTPEYKENAGQKREEHQEERSEYKEPHRDEHREDRPSEDAGKRLEEARRREDIQRDSSNERREAFSFVNLSAEPENRVEREPEEAKREERMRSGSNLHGVERTRSVQETTERAQNDSRSSAAPVKKEEAEPEKRADSRKSEHREERAPRQPEANFKTERNDRPGSPALEKKAPSAGNAEFTDLSFTNKKDNSRSVIHITTQEITHRNEDRNIASISLDPILRGPLANAAQNGDAKRAFDLAEEKRPYDIGNALSAGNLGGLARPALSLTAEMAFQRDTEGGRVVHKAMNVITPTSAYIARKFMRQGVIAINSQIRFNNEIFVQAYSAFKHVSLDSAAVDASKMVQQFKSTGGTFTNMAQLNDYLQTANTIGFFGMIQGMSKDDFVKFLDGTGVSQNLWETLLKTPRSYLGNMSFIHDLEKLCETSKDLELISMLKGSLLDAKFAGSPLGSAVKMLSRRLAYSALGNSEGSRGFNTATSLTSAMSTAYKVGMKGLTKASGKVLGSQSRVTTTMRVLQNPVKSAARHTIKTVIDKNAAKATTKGVIKVNGLASRIAGFQSRIASRMAAKAGAQAAVGAGTAGGSAGAAATGSAAVAGGTAAEGAAAGGSAAGSAGAAGGTAAGTVAGGWIVAIIVIVILLLMLILSNLKGESEEQTNMKPYNYADQTEIVAELTNEFEQMNTEFNRQINDASYHRGNYSNVVSYQADSTAVNYEAYKVYFRDAYGNELDPKTVDFNNTKAIVSMASQYIPYPIKKPADTASQAEKEKYEQIKQYFKDYCYMLWAATHRIDIEEYYPGDDKYSDVDDSGMETTKGYCYENGSTVWMPENMLPNFVSKTECEDCTTDFNTGHGEYAHALCSHPDEKYASMDGWKKTGKVKYHYNCPGHVITHTESGTDADGKPCSYTWSETVYCGDDKLYNATHKHASYEWQYQCGGHMSAVVYVTIGDVSRLPNMNAANDVDYGAVGKYIDGTTP